MIDRVWWFTALAMTVVAVATSLAPAATTDVPTHSDKGFHFLTYGVLCGLYLLAAVWRPSAGGLRFPDGDRVVLGFTVVLGGGIEVIQTALPYRSGDLRDFAANTIGAIGVWLVWRWRRARGLDHELGKAAAPS